MDAIYLVTWSGGYEQPSYFATTDPEQAEGYFLSWRDDANESDTLQILRIIPGERCTVEVIREFTEFA